MELQIVPTGVEVHIPMEKLQEIRQLSLSFLGKNLIADKDLRSFIGKCMNIAGVIHVWKPFITQFYAALRSYKPVGTPRNCTWTSQVKTGLLWVLAFLDHGTERELTKRVWSVNEYMHQGVRINITWDASPWGFGAVLYKDCQPIEYLYDQPTAFEQEFFDLEEGSSSSQQFLECLGGLVALREWGHIWRNRTVKLGIRNDNVGALVLLGQLETKSQRNAVIAREASLDIGMSSFGPQVVEHIPGISNITCDVLSRIFQPGFDWNSFPKCLQNVPRKQTTSRRSEWWKLLNPPCFNQCKSAK